MAETVIYNILCLSLILAGSVSCQRMDVNVSSTGICKGSLYRSVSELKRSLQGCVVIVGCLEISIEQGRKSDFNDTPFYNLREITEYLVIYRVRGLESIGQLFPNLTRIRGNKLLNNFALIVYDNQNLREIGLYSLLKIDRGGVIIWGLPQACFIETINWKILAANARRVISPSDRQVECNVDCRCNGDSDRNRCWNIKKCQLYIEGPESETCQDQCFGCRKTNQQACFTCGNYTHNFKCVAQCPSDTIILPDSKYCITKEECHNFGRLVWNNTCISECPIDFKVNNKTGTPICEPCSHCEMNCSSLVIQSLGSIQNAERCVFINGSLSIHLRAIPGAMSDLKAYLKNIQEVSDYISIESSDVITSLEFLPSLRVIGGKRLKDHRYSLYINHNYNLKALFTPNVMKNLVIQNGSALFEYNPVLCMNIIEKIKGRFPITPEEFDIPLGSNGYGGGCKEVRFDFKIKPTSDTSVQITFPIEKHDIHYSVLYVRLPPGVDASVVPESCSEFEWHDADVPTVTGNNFSIVELKDLLPASTYALCVEVYDPKNKILSRSNMLNFTTPVGIPEPPFIFELVAETSDAVVVQWVDHKNYEKHIKYYELDVELIEMNVRNSMIDYCKYVNPIETDDVRHALVRRPPPEYNRGCESMCGILSSVTSGAMVEDYFDVCQDRHIMCDNNEENMISNNSTLKDYIRTLVIDVNDSRNATTHRNNFQVAELAPFSDYKFRLRSCVGVGQCSRSTRGNVRTLRSKNADKPSITSLDIDEFGNVSIKWTPPKVTNGPILTYSVEVLPNVNINNLMPQTWCLSPQITEILVKSVIAPEYKVKVCLTTLDSKQVCSPWQRVFIPSAVPTTSKIILLWTGFVCGVLLYFTSLAVGWYKSRSGLRSDVVPLVDSSTSCPVESEAPAFMLSDFVPFQTIHLD